MPCAHDCLLYESVASDSLAMRFYWILWLGETARRRGIRLRRYEAAVAHIEHHRDGRAMAFGYQRWLMRTVSTLHSRRTTLLARCRYFYKWLLFAERQALCERRWKDVAQRCKFSVMQCWKERTLRRQRCNQHIAQAGEFCEAALRNRLLPFSFHRWMQRVRSRCEYWALEQAAYHHRTELVRKLTVNNLLSSVLLTFWQPSREESFPTAGSQPPKAKDVVTKTRTAADAHTTPTAAAACCVDSAVRPISEASVENDPVEALRRRLVARSAAIPLVGRMTHVDTVTPPIRAAAASAGSDPAACVKAHMTSPPIASGTLAEDASPYTASCGIALLLSR
ncbi:hypothetical protein TRSC58_00594 [Trypanosoma rangeli SC58]|uniref:Sfi1 spindle body domain-containing protein n=1 Tax=Trypanosoma rangeli SC58 TaxID=429131 RepID=A0A061JC45_TRYRA|nr:hypothetical protein TRSC58_00594 [Trypanosoma rangeli SC58]